jgi:hypothetical protein
MRVRLKQLSAWSQVKIILVAGMATTFLFAVILLVLVGAGQQIGNVQEADPYYIIAFAALFASAILVGGFTLLSIAGLLLLRLLPWRGPSLEVKEGAGVANVFE